MAFELLFIILYRDYFERCSENKQFVRKRIFQILKIPLKIDVIQNQFLSSILPFDISILSTDLIIFPFDISMFYIMKSQNPIC